MAVALLTLPPVLKRPMMASLVMALALAAVLAPGVGHAADAAKRALIGFSRDGTYFAFEQYGVQDGSGFPYSDIFVIDVPKDKWVRGTPALTLIRRGGASLDKAREESRNRIAPYLWRLNIGTKGRLAVSDPAAKADEAARFVAFTLPDTEDGPGLGTVRLRLTEIALPTDKCELTGKQTRGFSLVLENDAGEPIQILEEDTEIPASRGCPIHYGISDVIALPREGKGPALVVLISMYRFGFEGLDRRYLAIGHAFEEPPEGRDKDAGHTITREDVAPAASPPEEAGKGRPRPPAGEIPSYLINRGSSRND